MEKIEKTILLKGVKGASGEGGEDKTIPYESIIAFEGEEIPEGYELYKET